MQVQLFEKLANGLPGTALINDVSDRATETIYSHGALWGPLAATVRVPGSLVDGFTLAEQTLGCPLEISDERGDVQWSGVVWAVSFGDGRRGRTRSLEGYYNRVRVFYDNYSFGTVPPMLVAANQTELRDDAAGQATYGIIEQTYTPGQMAQPPAAAYATRLLADRSRLLYAPENGVDGIELRAYGWYWTLFNQSYQAAVAGQADVGAVIQTILSSGSCPFIVQDFSNLLTTTGTNTPRQYSKFEKAGEIIKKAIATTSGHVFGIDVTRRPYLRAYNRLSTTPTYIEYAEGVIEDQWGGTVPPYAVRPDSVLRQAQFVPTNVNLSTAVAGIESIYLSETQYSTLTGLSYKGAVAGVDGAIEP